MKPLLKVASSRLRALGGTSIGPREGSSTEGSNRPAYSEIVVREVLIQATPATRRGYSEGSLRKVVTSSGGSLRLSLACVGRHTPSPGSGGYASGRTRGGRSTILTLPLLAPAAGTPTFGSACSAGPPFSGASSE